MASIGSIEVTLEPEQLRQLLDEIRQLRQRVDNTEQENAFWRSSADAALRQASEALSASSWATKQLQRRTQRLERMLWLLVKEHFQPAPGTDEWNNLYYELAPRELDPEDEPESGQEG